MEVFTLAALIALVVKLTSSLKYLRAGQFGDFGSQVVVWGIGVGVALLAANANALEQVDVNGVKLGVMDTASAVILGLSLASLGSVVYDQKKARDGADSAAEPSLFPPKG